MPDHTCPDYIDRGPNPLWQEVMALHARVRELEADSVSLRQAFYDATAQAFEIGKHIAQASRPTKAELLWAKLWESLYEAVRDHEAGLNVLSELRRGEDRQAELSAEVVRLRRGDFTPLEAAALSARGHTP